MAVLKGPLLSHPPELFFILGKGYVRPGWRATGRTPPVRVGHLRGDSVTWPGAGISSPFSRGSGVGERPPGAQKRLGGMNLQENIVSEFGVLCFFEVLSVSL